jgi:hypothetical protein
VLELDHGLERGEEHFELLAELGAVGGERGEVDGLAGFEAGGHFGDELVEPRGGCGGLGWRQGARHGF